jgi:hypothetical protein
MKRHGAKKTFKYWVSLANRHKKPNEHNFYFQTTYPRWLRHPKTTGSLRTIHNDHLDPDLIELKVKPRGRQKNLPANYDDMVQSRHRMKSWKDFTRKRKPWE